MRATTMLYVSIVILVLGFFWNLPVGSHNWPARNSDPMELLNLLVCLNALLVVAHRFWERKYSWPGCREAIPAPGPIDGEAKRPSRQFHAEAEVAG